MWRILFIVLSIIGIISFFQVTSTYRMKTRTAQTASVVLLPDPIPSPVLPGKNFSASGTLVFYPNNVGPVPYLIYTDDTGHMVSKALLFPEGAPPQFSFWTGAHISIQGETVAEHVVVSTIRYDSAP